MSILHPRSEAPLIAGKLADLTPYEASVITRALEATDLTRPDNAMAYRRAFGDGRDVALNGIIWNTFGLVHPGKQLPPRAVAWAIRQEMPEYMDRTQPILTSDEQRRQATHGIDREFVDEAIALAAVANAENRAVAADPDRTGLPDDLVPVVSRALYAQVTNADPNSYDAAAARDVMDSRGLQPPHRPLGRILQTLHLV